MEEAVATIAATSDTDQVINPKELVTKLLEEDSHDISLVLTEDPGHVGIRIKGNGKSAFIHFNESGVMFTHRFSTANYSSHKIQAPSSSGAALTAAIKEFGQHSYEPNNMNCLDFVFFYMNLLNLASNRCDVVRLFFPLVTSNDAIDTIAARIKGDTPDAGTGPENDPVVEEHLFDLVSRAGGAAAGGAATAAGGAATGGLYSTDPNWPPPDLTPEQRSAADAKMDASVKEWSEKYSARIRTYTTEATTERHVDYWTCNTNSEGMREFEKGQLVVSRLYFPLSPRGYCCASTHLLHLQAWLIFKLARHI